MKSLTRIQAQLSIGDYTLSRHAFRRVIERNISEREISEAGTDAIIIEDYPADKYSPSCLLLGYTAEDRPLHIHVSRADTEKTRIITIYEPSDDEWQPDYRTRR